MTKSTISSKLKTDIEFDISYGQFYIYDPAHIPEDISLTNDHFSQGFARSQYFLVVRSLVATGTAKLSYFYLGELLDKNNFLRVISIPLIITSGYVSVDGPENHGLLTKKIPPGEYRVFIYQRLDDVADQIIKLVFKLNDNNSAKSEIIVADESITRTRDLIESM